MLSSWKLREKCQKLRILMKICGFWRKSVVFDENRGFQQKPQILMKTVDFDENCGFWQKLQILMKTADFDENHRFWSKNCTFWWKPQFSGRFKLRNCKNHISNSTFNRTTSNTEIHGFLSEMKGQLGTQYKYRGYLLRQDYLPKKVTPIFVLCTQLTPFKTIWSNFIIVYPIESFQDHMTWLFVLCTQISTFKTIWPNFIIVDPNWLHSRPYDLIFVLCTEWTPFKIIWPNFIFLYPIDPFQDHLT